MGVGIVPLSTTDLFRTVYIGDTAIVPTERDDDGERTGGSDFVGFLTDRTRIDLLEFKAPPPDAPWDGPTYFDMRPLSVHEVQFAVVQAAAEARAADTSLEEDAGRAFLLRWAFRLSCVAWESLWTVVDGKPVEAPYEAKAAGSVRLMTCRTMRYVPAPAAEDLGGVALIHSEISVDEGKVFGSQEQIPENSTASPKSAETIAPAALTRVSA